MAGINNSDGPHNNGPRNLSESKNFTKEKDDLLSMGECKRLDEIIACMDIGLCQNPERYPIAVDGTELRMFITEKFITIPSFKIWYTFDDETVHLLHIELNDE